MQAIDQATIQVGDVWESFRTAHMGWRIRITKVAANSVEYQLVRGPAKARRVGRTTRNEHLSRAVLCAGFQLVQRKERLMTEGTTDLHQIGEQVTTQLADITRVCQKCGRLKPIEDFDFTPTKTYPKTHRIYTCHPCVVEARAAGIRRGHAERAAAKAAAEKKETSLHPTGADGHLVFNHRSLAEVEAHAALAEAQAQLREAEASVALDHDPQAQTLTWEPGEEPAVPTTNGRSPLSSALLELAAQAEHLERPPTYRQLYDAIEVAMRQGTNAGTVFVIPAEVWLDIELAHEAAAASDFAP